MYSHSLQIKTSINSKKFLAWLDLSKQDYKMQLNKLRSSTTEKCSLGFQTLTTARSAPWLKTSSPTTISGLLLTIGERATRAGCTMTSLCSMLRSSKRLWIPLTRSWPRLSVFSVTKNCQEFSRLLNPPKEILNCSSHLFPWPWHSGLRV